MKRKSELKKKLSAIFLSAAVAVSAVGNGAAGVIDVQAAEAAEGAYGVGVGKEIPEQVFAPFVDIVSWTSNQEYASAGSLSLEKMYKDTGILYYNLGFIMADTHNPTVTDGVLNWTWGGYSSLSESATDQWQLDGIKASINYIRSVGGDVIVSIGGLNEGNFFQYTQDEDVLYQTYMNVVQGYGLTRLDLDIEGTAQNKEQNVVNAKALKRVQEETGVEIVLTLPVLPSGLTEQGLWVLDAYLENGVDVDMVNIMTMCYGNGTLLAGENYGTASLRAVTSLAGQIKERYANILNVTLTEDEVYKKIGTTVSIGYESAAHPIWTTEWSQLVVDQAIELGLGMVSFWCLNRDCMQYGENSGIYGMYEHTDIFKTFMQGDNEYEVPEEGAGSGGNAGGGDSGETDGDSESTIKEWSVTGVYVEGDRVIYNGKIWEAAWWTQGTEPGSPEDSGAEVWRYISDAEGGSSGNDSENGDKNEEVDTEENPGEGSTEDGNGESKPEENPGEGSTEDGDGENKPEENPGEGGTEGGDGENKPEENPGEESTEDGENKPEENPGEGSTEGGSGESKPEENPGEEGGTGGSTGNSGNTGNGGSTGENVNTGNGSSTGGNVNTGSGNITGGNVNTGSGNSTGGNINTGNDGSIGGGENTGTGENIIVSGKSYKVGKFVYRLHSAKNKTVTLYKYTNKKAESVKIPAAVTIQGVKYRVDAIGKKVFANYSRLKKVTIGKNVKTIGAKAFYGCKKLKMVTISTKSLKSVGKKAFSKISHSAKIKVPSAKKKAYKKLLPNMNIVK